MVILASQSLACDEDEIENIIVQLNKQLGSFELYSGALPENLSYEFKEHREKGAINWLHQAREQATNPQTKDDSGSVKLLLIPTKLQTEAPAVMLDSLDVLHIPHSVWTLWDIVQAHFFPSNTEFQSGQLFLNRDLLKGCVVIQGTGIAWNHIASSGSTIGIAWYSFEEDRKAIAYVLAHLIRYRQLMFHHLLIPLLMLQAQLILLEPCIMEQIHTIQGAQMTSGFHPYAGVKPVVLTDHFDIGQLSAHVSGTAANLAASRDCLQGLLDLATSVKEETESWIASRALTATNDTAHVFIRESTAFWEKECKAVLQFSRSWGDKATIVVQGVFNLTAQRDRNTTIMIANESKRDSTAMKSIAAVTMVFLPGTFVATFLSMSIFQMDPGSQTLTSHQMWLYWIITIPLTLLTLFGWLTWDHISATRWNAKQLSPAKITMLSGQHGPSPYITLSRTTSNADQYACV